jgi:hypothetical protein
MVWNGETPDQAGRQMRRRGRGGLAHGRRDPHCRMFRLGIEVVDGEEDCEHQKNEQNGHGAPPVIVTTSLLLAPSLSFRHLRDQSRAACITLRWSGRKARSSGGLQQHVAERITNKAAFRNGEFRCDLQR